MKTTDKPIVVSQTFNASIDTVWNAITELHQMQQWFFENIPDFKAEVGFKTQFNVASEERNFLHLWEIAAVIPEQKIVYLWKYEEYTGSTLVTFDLTKNNNQTKLTVTNMVLEDFPQDIPEFKPESCLGGWEYFIKNRLKDYLNKSL